MLTGNETNRQLGIYYLEELRHKNKANEKYNSIQVEQYMHDKKLNEYEKLNAVQQKARMIEQKAKMKERLIAVERKENRRKWRQDENER